jgi:hypothetical protein
MAGFGEKLCVHQNPPLFSLRPVRDSRAKLDCGLESQTCRTFRGFLSKLHAQILNLFRPPALARL